MSSYLSLTSYQGSCSLVVALDCRVRLLRVRIKAKKLTFYSLVKSQNKGKKKKKMKPTNQNEFKDVFNMSFRFRNTQDPFWVMPREAYRGLVLVLNSFSVRFTKHRHIIS